jgi:hypothetical protein
MKFADLLKRPTDKPPEIQQREAGLNFWAEFKRVGMSRWSPGQPVPQSGAWLLIGLAPSWSTYDLDLVDQLIDTISRTKTAQTSFFDVDDICKSADINLYIPGLHKFYQTPVVGLWEDGQLIESAEGAKGRELIRRSLG